MLSTLKQDATKKLFIAGKQDKMLPESVLKKDADLGGFNFVSVNNASHFVTFDQPESVAGLIEDLCDKKLRSKYEALFKNFRCSFGTRSIGSNCCLGKSKKWRNHGCG